MQVCEPMPETEFDNVTRSLYVRVALLAFALTIVFWHPLWFGGGLVGSDIYAYFLPQKQVYAQALAAGEPPLWNNRVGHGYPQLAESQTGACYPFHLVLYRVLSPNAAYNANIIIHYALAFWFTWLYARRLKLSPVGAGLAALVYVYGWFPARICLEWSIIGGTWLPASLLCVENFWRTRFWRYPILLTIVLALQMLAGHFLIAFLTQLTLVAYVVARVWWGRVDEVSCQLSVVSSKQAEVSGQKSEVSPPKTTDNGRRKPDNSKRLTGVLLLAIAAAFPLAAVQLVPTWELKQFSQRAVEGPDLHLGQGHIPVWYWSQVVAPWFWYFDDIDLNRALPAGSALTNKVEAHLYFGLLPFALIVWGLCSRSRRDVLRRPIVVWMLIGLAALLYTPGWLITVTRYLPGFRYFEGPGRYGVVTTLAMALVAGACWDVVSRNWRTQVRSVVVAVVFALTVADLWVVSRFVTSAFLTWAPPISSIQHSPIRDYLSDWPEPVRLFCRGANVPTLLGVASTPTYLGLGPTVYFDPQLKIPEPLPFREDGSTGPVTPEQLDWLRRAGVTHVLSFAELDRTWPVQVLWWGEDPILNAVWARPRQPLYLYGLVGSRGRVACEPVDNTNRVRITSYRDCEVVVEASIPENPAGSARVILTDLAFAGWTVTVDDQPAESVVVEGMFRGVDVAPGQHTIVWRYRPAAVWWGVAISLATAFVLAVFGHLRYWHPKLFSRRGR